MALCILTFLVYTALNFLQAYEKLNADLVVLSAFETGYGDFEQGEGIVSLARSFMYAGTPALVVSLWSVNDMSTSIIMQSFYQNIAAGMPKDKALRQAKLDYIQRAGGNAAHPAFWSPFIQLGDTKAIPLQKKGSWLYWIIGTLCFLVIAGILWFRKPKKAIA
jgi:CHAT domain-containing protein